MTVRSVEIGAQADVIDTSDFNCVLEMFYQPAQWNAPHFSDALVVDLACLRSGLTAVSKLGRARRDGVLRAWCAL